MAGYKDILDWFIKIAFVCSSHRRLDGLAYYTFRIINKLFQSWKRKLKQNRQVVNEDKYKYLKKKNQCL